MTLILPYGKAEPSSTRTIIICLACEGYGVISEYECVNYHRGEYATTNRLCATCDGKGRLIKTTKVHYEKFQKENE